MAVLVTGAAGFIGSYVTAALLSRGEKVIAIDNLNDYYEVSLKKARLKNLKENPNAKNLTFIEGDICDYEKLCGQLKDSWQEIEYIVHLAAYAGVRYSMEKPFLYGKNNLLGHLSMLELCRNLPNFKHMAYASSSSVYGRNAEVPFSLKDRAETPISLYGATKRADEIMSASYSHLYNLRLTGLRFFTVYGPLGRPDMAYYFFTKNILQGKPIKIFNQGDMRRDFTYIDDIVSGIIAALYSSAGKKETLHRNYNLGNSHPENLMEMVRILEDSIGKKAIVEYAETPPGDMFVTYADISESTKDFGYMPKTKISEGLRIFVKWYLEYYKA